MNIHLSDCDKNKDYTFLFFEKLDSDLFVRLQELGFVAGTTLRVVAFSPRKETLLVCVYGSMFAIKKQVAEQMVVTR